MQVTLVIDDRLLSTAARVTFVPHGDAFNDVIESNLTADLGDDRNFVRIPLTQHLTFFDYFVFRNGEHGSGRNVVFLELTTLWIEQDDFTVTGQDNLASIFVRYAAHLCTFNGTTGLRADFAFFNTGVHRTADVKGPHRKLCSRFTDRLSTDDADRHALFDHGAGRHIHAVAASAYTERCIASHWAADLNLLQAHFLDLASDIRRDHFVFFDDHFVGYGVHDVVS